MEKIVLGITTVKLDEVMFNITISATKASANKEGLTVQIIDNTKNNRGSFYPLLELYKKYPKADIIGIMHDDCAIYEKDWDIKLREMFKDKKLGAVGLFGWQKIDKYGIDSKPIGNPFEKMKAVPYRRVKTLTPAVTLDSMCMFFRRECIPLLDIQEGMLIRHGYDKIWPMRLQRKGYKVGVSGFSFQHKGMAAFQDPGYLALMKKWFDAHWNLDFPVESVEGMMLFEGRVLFRNEFKDMLPRSV